MKTNTIKKQVENIFVEAQTENVKGGKKGANTNLSAKWNSNSIDSRTNRKVAVVVIDSTLRSFKNCTKAIFENRTNIAVSRLLAEKGLKSSLFADYKKLADFVKEHGKSRYINSEGIICHEKVAKSANTDKIEYYTALGFEIRYKDEEKTKAVALEPAHAWSVSAFINMVAFCNKQATKGQPTAVTADSVTAYNYLQDMLK